MKKKQYQVLIYAYIIILGHHTIHPITLVYNMKVRRAAAQDTPIDTQNENGKKRSLVLTTIPIVYARNRHFTDNTGTLDVTEKRLSCGSLLNGLLTFENNWWVDIFIGIEKESLKARGTLNFDAQRFGLDDTVISVGKRISITSGLEFHVYGIGGIPNHFGLRPEERFDTLVGTRLFSTGFGAEASYSIINRPEKACVLLTQARFIHFYRRNWSSIIPNSTFNPGNINDVLLSIRLRFANKTGEFGYNGTFFTNQSLQVGLQRIESPLFLRNSAFVSFGYLLETIPLTQCPGSVGTGLLISTSKRFDTHIYAAWIYAGISF